MSKNAICLGCGKSYERSTGLRGRMCSNACKLGNPRAKKKCAPDCSPEKLRIRDVVFKNGITHRQQVCQMCRRTKYLPKGSNQKDSEVLAVREQAEDRVSRYGDSFYADKRWLHMRYLVFRQYGKSCMCCGSSTGVMHVDHIKPRSKYPELELDINNLQILCKDCNLGKSAWDETDWRPHVRKEL